MTKKRKHLSDCAPSLNLDGLEEINHILANKFRSASTNKMVKKLDKLLAEHGFTHVAGFVYKHTASGKTVEVCLLGLFMRVVWDKQ
ncbi:MAG: hypothetical protein GY862_31080 [Gammaproteobacteria bacterium]|nr:hypothetical protein [Gammaproteobacteria bacterium]